MYRIGLFSKMGKVTVKTLHHYDEVGLLKPAFVDMENGYRYYETEQLFILQKIVVLRQMGFSIAEILDIFAGRNVSGILNQRRAELVSERDYASAQLFRLDQYIENRQKEGNIMSDQVVIKEIPECIVFSKRQVIPNYSDLMTLVPSIGKAVAQANPDLECAVPEYCFNIYHDGEYKQENVDVEICEAVTAWGKETEGIIFKEMPAVTVACVTHRGSYEKLGSSYAYGLQWIKENGYTLSDHIRENFIDGIWNKEDEADWLTEIQFPIMKK